MWKTVAGGVRYFWLAIECSYMGTKWRTQVAPNKKRKFQVRSIVTVRGIIGQACDMRSFPAASLMRSFCAAACWALLALQSEASDPNKPLTEYTHTVWTPQGRHPGPRSSTRSHRLRTAIFGWPRRTDLSALTASGLSTGVAKTAIRHFWVWCGVCAPRGMGVSGSGLRTGLVGHIRGEDLTTFSVGAQAEAMLEDRDGTLWVTTQDRVLRFRAGTQEQIGAAITLPGNFCPDRCRIEMDPSGSPQAAVFCVLTPASRRVRP